MDKKITYELFILTLQSVGSALWWVDEDEEKSLDPEDFWAILRESPQATEFEPKSIRLDHESIRLGVDRIAKGELSIQEYPIDPEAVARALKLSSGEVLPESWAMSWMVPLIVQAVMFGDIQYI
jgi:hypothetical protein